ncbi:hypothetical protein B0H12DRAFT_1246985 [Mycena haematopus]|nr:hypothetical protein B0H12DRAFT_1246985 [Mycena haematopus]
MSGFLYLPPFVFRASTLRCPSSSGVYGCLPFDFSWLRLPASALWHPPAPSSVVAVVAYTFFVPSGVSHRLTIFPSRTLTPSVLIPVSEPSPFLPDFVLPPARDITAPQSTKPNMNIPAHTQTCKAKASYNLAQFRGQAFGEGLESGWVHKENMNIAAHTQTCKAKPSYNLPQFAGQTFGEGVESGWVR